MLCFVTHTSCPSALPVITSCASISNCMHQSSVLIIYALFYKQSSYQGFAVMGRMLHLIKFDPLSINFNFYINKEELKTVVRDILACAQPNRHETFTAHWNPYRRVSSRGRRAKIRFSRGARGEKPENDRPPFWFYGKSIRTSVHGSHIVSVEAPSRNAIVGTI